MKLRRAISVGLLAWLVLLCLSTGVRFFRGFTPQPLASQEVAEIALDEHWVQGGSVTLAYRHYPAHDSKKGHDVLLLHGNPMAGRAMIPLAEAISPQRAVWLPDLPGLGFSSRNLTAYSAVNQVSVLLRWFDQIGIETMHVVAYSQGGAVALELVRRAPGRVASISLLAAVGVQEEELLGQYELNQPIYLLYQAFAWSLRWLTPHFGLLEDPVFSPTAARNFADTDLRRNRPILESLEQPTLILHAVDDQLVPFAAAREHAQLVAHAVFKSMEGGHMAPIRDAGKYAGELQDFFESVEAGVAPLPATFAALNGAHQPANALRAPTSSQHLHVLVFALLVFAMVFVSEDLACIAGGLLAAGGGIPLSLAILACFAGIWVSDVFLYCLGRFFGPGILKVPPFRKLRDSGGLERFRAAYARRGLKVVFATRFLPGSRVIAYLTAGMLRLGVFRFAFWMLLAAAVWTPILVVTAYWVGQPLINWWDAYGLRVLPLIALGLLLAAFAVHTAFSAMTYRGRAALRGRWLRWTHWEFWPGSLVYIPVFLYCTALAIRYRSPTVWALSNPGMEPLSGLAMESKSEILVKLNPDSGKLPAWCILDPDTEPDSRWKTLASFLADQPQPWPVVLKPDIGQRGEGVAVVRNADEARRYLGANPDRIIAQAYVSGPEFGVFYTRHPGRSKGSIFSITRKELPEVEGDGKRSLEQLVLDDPRAVALASHYLKVNRTRLTEVPAAGERIRLVELGTHCRGAIFLDGSDCISDALVGALDEVVADYPGFHFGRFDLRATSADSLRAGESFKVLELNGVSSESTNIYDPKNSIFSAWCMLFRQWALAFEIGALNRSAGMRPPTLRSVFKTLSRHRKRTVFEATQNRVE